MFVAETRCVWEKFSVEKQRLISVRWKRVCFYMKRARGKQLFFTLFFSSLDFHFDFRMPFPPCLLLRSLNRLPSSSKLPFSILVALGLNKSGQGNDVTCSFGSLKLQRPRSKAILTKAARTETSSSKMPSRGNRNSYISLWGDPTNMSN